MIIVLIGILLVIILLGEIALSLFKSEKNKTIAKILLTVIASLILGVIAFLLVIFAQLSNKSDIYMYSCVAVMASIEFITLATIWKWWRVQAVRVAAVFLTVASIGAMAGSIAGDYREKRILKVEGDTYGLVVFEPEK